MKIGGLKYRCKSSDTDKCTQNSYIKVFFEGEVWFGQAVGFCRYKPFSLDSSPEDNYAIVEWLVRSDKKRSWSPYQEYSELAHLHVQAGNKKFMDVDRWVNIYSIAGVNVIAFPTGPRRPGEYIMCDWDMTVTVD